MGHCSITEPQLKGTKGTLILRNLCLVLSMAEKKMYGIEFTLHVLLIIDKRLIAI